MAKITNYITMFNIGVIIHPCRDTNAGIVYKQRLPALTYWGRDKMAEIL